MADDEPYIDLITGKPIEPWAADLMRRRHTTPSAGLITGEAEHRLSGEEDCR